MTWDPTAGHSLATPSQMTTPLLSPPPSPKPEPGVLSDLEPIGAYFSLFIILKLIPSPKSEPGPMFTWSRWVRIAPVSTVTKLKPPPSPSRGCCPTGATGCAFLLCLLSP